MQEKYLISGLFSPKIDGMKIAFSFLNPRLRIISFIKLRSLSI